MRKHKILFLTASPSGTPPLALQQEVDAIQAELQRSRRRKRFVVVTRGIVQCGLEIRDCNNRINERVKSKSARP